MYLDTLLETVQNLMERDKGMSKKMKLHIRKKGHNERARIAKLLHFKGPDDDTRRLLDRYKASWVKNPSEFWQHPAANNASSVQPLARIFAYYLRTKEVDA